MQLTALLDRTRVETPDLSLFEQTALVRLDPTESVEFPRTTAAELRRAADTLPGFVLVERRGLHRDAFPALGTPDRMALAAWDATLAREEGAVPRSRQFVLTPIANLDPLRADQVEMYAGPLSAAGAQALATVAPALRSLDRRVTALEDRAADEAQRQSWDPLIFAIPAGADIGTYDGPVKLGPCWGPDLPPIAAALAAAKGDSRALARFWGR